jgi:ubiquinone/menaquinone biosynthesis C-methylase UbiE
MDDGMDDERAQMLDPTTFFVGDGWFDDPAKLREGIRERFQTFYAYERKQGATKYDLDRISTGIFYLRTLLERNRLSGKDRIALEIGCGVGNKSLAIHDLFGAYYGIDISPYEIAIARERAKIHRCKNLHFIEANGVEVISNRSKYNIPEKIDLLMLYAVLEHLTLHERTNILQIANSVISRGGHILVMETPNRLIPVDSHTSQIIYLNNLPDDMANDYWKINGQRAEACNTLLPSSDDRALEVLYRLGRGVSYHDFEIGLPFTFDDINFIADSFDSEMLNIEPSNYQEISLLGDLLSNIPSVPALAFSRSWIDFIIGSQLHTQRRYRRFISPFWPQWLALAKPTPFFEQLGVIIDKKNPCWQALQNSHEIEYITLIFSSEQSTGSFHLYINGDLITTVDCAKLEAARPSRWHRGYSVSVQLRRPIRELKIENIKDGSTLFQGCVLTSLYPF